MSEKENFPPKEINLNNQAESVESNSVEESKVVEHKDGDVVEDNEREKTLTEIKERVNNLYDSEDKNIIDPRLLGDFFDSKIEDNKIIFSDEDQRETTAQVHKIKMSNNFRLPSLMTGIKTATTYDSQVTNFSTKTNIIKTKDGKRIFAVDCYPASQIHRWCDGLGKRMVGHKFVKVPSSRWKKVFEERSNIPVINNDDSRVALMPYLPNINLRDLMAGNKDIDDFGECKWAENIKLEDKKEIVNKIIDEVGNLHNQGKTWGETILHNMIITNEQKVVVCDPETVYDNNVPQIERMASDLRDVAFSISGALLKSKEINDPQEIINQVLSRYNNKEVVGELKRLVSQKKTLIQKIFMSFYETVRIGVKNMKEYDQVKQAILNFEN